MTAPTFGPMLSAMKQPSELHQLSDWLFIWQTYDATVKADLFSTAIATDSGFYIVDPVAIDHEGFTRALGARTVAGVVVTNANHARGAASFASQYDVPIYVHSSARQEVNYDRGVELDQTTNDLHGLRVIEIEGAASGEVALYRAADGGTLVIGDALINSGSYGFTPLPAKYCTAPKRLKKSLRRLLELPFERMLFAHGAPMLSGAHGRLAELLDAHA